LLGRTVSEEEIERLGPTLPPPVPMRGGDMVFVRRVYPPQDSAIWTKQLPSPDVLPLPDDREQMFVTAVTRSLLVGVLVGGGVAVALALAFARGILRPVGALTAAARRMERGDLSQRVEVHTHDEIGQLAHAFNAMADGLERTEQLRRTMVTDVAHELRT